MRTGVEVQNSEAWTCGTWGNVPSSSLGGRLLFPLSFLIAVYLLPCLRFYFGGISGVHDRPAKKMRHGGSHRLTTSVLRETLRRRRIVLLFARDT